MTTDDNSEERYRKKGSTMRSVNQPQTSCHSAIENMNDLNAPACRLPTPDILCNIPGGSHRDTTSRRNNDDQHAAEQSVQDKRPVVFDDGRICGCKSCKKITKTQSKKRRRMIRGMCCFGWIFCCPVFTLAWALRTAPIDKQDLQDDDCYPCYGASK